MKAKNPSRRTVLTTVAAAATALVAPGAKAGAIPQKSVKYQTSPNEGHQCSLCKLFIPGPTPEANGTCKSVAGDITPKGWCVLFVAKT